MPRPRKDPLRSLLDPIAQRFAAEVSAAVMSHVEARVREEVQAVVGRAFRGSTGAARGRRLGAAPGRNLRPCRVPGCGRPSKGPRFDYFCAEHRELPAAEKEAIKKAQPTGAPNAGDPADGAAKRRANAHPKRRAAARRVGKVARGAK